MTGSSQPTPRSAGLRTTVRNKSPEATAPLAAAGAWVAASAQDATKDARVVITMLPTADAVDTVMSAKGMAAFTPGAVWTQLGTIGLAATTGFEETLQLRPDVMFVDAPVSGQQGAGGGRGRRPAGLRGVAVQAGYGRDDVSAVRLCLGDPARTGA
jgi:3-hydroxyisobutyrate dehydrogenase-like beta-hydroxyacid dehydrogenase